MQHSILGRRTTTGLALAALLTTGLAAAPAYAADLVVTTTADDGEGSLRRALSLATASPGDDRITFAPGVTGTIFLTTGQLETYVGAGSGNLVIEGPGAEALSIDAQETSRVLAVFGPAEGELPSLALSGLTLTRGKVGDGQYTYDYQQSDGGYRFDKDTRAGDRGGGLRVLRAHVSLQDVVVSHSAADQDGGGVSVEDGSLSIVQGAIRANVVASMTPPYIYSPGEPAASGGGVFADEVSLSDSEVVDNKAQISGGAVWAQSVVVERSTLAGNTAGGGAAVGIKDTQAANQVSITSSTVTDNVSRGAVIYGTDIELTSSTVAHNLHGVRSDGTIRLTSSIVAANAGGDLLGAGRAALTRSLVQDPGSFAIDDDGLSVVGQDPRLSDLGNHGGLTRTLLPAANSVVVDRGQAEGSADQRGSTRVVGGAADMGSVELSDTERTGQPRIGNTRAPTVLGVARVGERLTVDPGAWDVAAADLSIQWLRFGVPIPGATGQFYDVTPPDHAARLPLSVRVTATAPGHVSGRSASALTNTVELGLMQQSRPAEVTGRLKVGSTLRARPRAGSVMPAPESVNVRWYVGGGIASYNSRTLRLEKSMRGKRVRVVFRYNGQTGYANLKDIVRNRRLIR